MFRPASLLQAAGFALTIAGMAALAADLAGTAYAAAHTAHTIVLARA